MEQSGAESDEKEKLVWPFWINGRFAAPRLGGGFEWTRGRDGCAKVAVRALLRERRESANLFPQPFGHGHETAVVEVPHANETPEGIHRPPIAFSRERRVHRRSLEQTTLVDDEAFRTSPWLPSRERESHRTHTDQRCDRVPSPPSLLLSECAFLLKTK